MIDNVENAYPNSEIHSTASVYRNVDIRKSRIGENCSIGDDTSLLKSVIEDRVAVNKRNLIQNSKIGRFSYTGHNTVVKFAEIGRFCSISWNVSIGGKNHDIKKVTTNSEWWFHKLDSGHSLPPSEYLESDECVIGNDVWIASNVIILRNVKVGNGAIIGAGAVVSRDVEPYAIVTGIPAKMKKKRFEDHIIEALEEIQWWNWPLETIRQN
ncbi:MAG: hypothetical protein EOO43_01980, partial [Flavobacterium sp.]